LNNTRIGHKVLLISTILETLKERAHIDLTHLVARLLMTKLRTSLSHYFRFSKIKNSSKNFKYCKLFTCNSLTFTIFSLTLSDGYLEIKMIKVFFCLLEECVEQNCKSCSCEKSRN